VLCKIRNCHVCFKEQLEHFPTIGAKDFKGRRWLHIKSIQEYTIQNSAPRVIKPAQHVESTVLTQLEVLCENRYFSEVFKEQLKHFPTIGAKDLRVDIDCRKAHIKNTLSKIAPRHSINQHKTMNRPSPRNLRFHAKIAIFRYFSKNK